MSGLTSGKEPDPAHGEIIGAGAFNRDNRKSPVPSSEPKSILNRFLLQRSSQAKDNKMTTIASLIAAMQQNYALIMDADKKPPHGIASRAAIPDHDLPLLHVDNYFLRCVRNLDLVWPNSRISYVDSWHFCNGHNVRNCRSDTTARHEDSERSPKLHKRIGVAP